MIAPGYDAASAGVSALFPFVFKPAQRVLDIGAGSGRDMARLLSLGIDALGIEPCKSVVFQNSRSLFDRASGPPRTLSSRRGSWQGTFPADCLQRPLGVNGATNTPSLFSRASGP